MGWRDSDHCREQWSTQRREMLSRQPALLLRGDGQREHPGRRQRNYGGGCRRRKVRGGKAVACDLRIHLLRSAVAAGVGSPRIQMLQPVIVVNAEITAG